MFGIFGHARAKHPPLTEYCTWLCEPANFLKAANEMAAERWIPNLSPEEETRAKLLYLVILNAAGMFDLRGDRKKEKLEAFEGLRDYFRDTNLDVITAEVIVWVHFLLLRLFVADQKKDHERTMQRVGYDSFSYAETLTFLMIEQKTGVNFRETGRRKMYQEALDRGVSVIEPFASVVLGSVERRSLTDPLKKFDLLEVPPQEWTALCVRVGIFSSTMPQGAYGSFKEGLKQLIDQGR